MATNELERFLAIWDRETGMTVQVLRALPASQYDFRPDGGGRSLGELAWHMAESDAFISYGIEAGFSPRESSAITITYGDALTAAANRPGAP